MSKDKDGIAATKAFDMVKYCVEKYMESDEDPPLSEMAEDCFGLMTSKRFFTAAAVCVEVFNAHGKIDEDHSMQFIKELLVSIYSLQKYDMVYISKTMDKAVEGAENEHYIN